MRRTDCYPYIGGQMRNVSLGKRAHKGIIIARHVPPGSDLSRAIIAKMLTRMEEYEREQVRVMVVHAGQAWWITPLQALQAKSEEDAWRWLST